MELYFHHVGQAGADADFPKTLFTDVSTNRILAAIPSDDPLREEIVLALHKRFPAGVCNVWGVPVGARTSIANLRTGDEVLLVESVSGEGSVPALCPDVLYWNRAYHAMSDELWGNAKYPFVFFFRTESLDFTWQEMRSDLGYSPEWIPRNFFRITPVRVVPFGRPEG
jgi:5-methylcytosine-specific restriction protein A